jgi:hypothetical protein
MTDVPLAGVAVSTETWAGAAEAGMLLRLLGATVSLDEGPAALSSGGVTVDATPTDAATDWAASGAMALTGRADGPPLHSTGQPATVARAAGFVLELLSAGRDPAAGRRRGAARRTSRALGAHPRGRGVGRRCDAHAEGN